MVIRGDGPWVAVEWFFAYGLEIDLRTMRERIGGWRSARNAVLRGHRLTFDVPDRRLGGTLPNLRPHPGGEVHGVLYEIEEGRLDLVGKHYVGFKWDQVAVQAAGGGRMAWVLRHEGPGAPGAPRADHLATLLWAMRQRGFPRAHVEGVAAAASRPRAPD